MKEVIKEVLISEDKIKETVKRLGEELNSEYGDNEVTLIVILKGSMVFAADLMRELKMPVKLEFMRVSSYGNSSKSSGQINIKLDLDADIKGKNVIIAEDIIDSGNTLYKLREELLKREPKSLKLCTLLSKPSRREADIEADYIGIKIEDKFVIGYGLDYAERYRNLPYIGILDIEE